MIFSYQQEVCFAACWQRSLIDKCKCYDLTSNHTFADKPARPCLSFEDVYCDGLYFAYFYSQDVRALCSAECPLECNRAIYSAYTSFVEYPSKAYGNILRKNSKILALFGNDVSAITDDALKRTLLQMNIYYSELSYHQYSESEKTSMTDLVSGIGGTLGLFLGMSFLSFIEILDLLFQIGHILIKPKRSNV